ncbi:flagellar biosynthetic protein FliQ [Gammaproteobacteria bacterium]|jgi:flagellar biosynthetic protein FliQ|nr:flagellar biosynthetic protein FliQ [Gammaproteobacteria bacterium]MDA9188421.1 flagellar biosynthetic protein FliQ [bacterium]MDP4745615.1 flagellar biosynthetic protein FliQ [Porticoccaceae bacterium]MDP4942426.1 flagellar biosynthetic protein FliQ [OM182 bacterium]MDA8601650.1 flagellar biosynthetic protein FliQ [Gammaproteobacteria bacterium]
MMISDVVTLGQEALWVTALIAGPLLLGILIVGVVIGILQAATSVQEMTLSFIPKLIVLVALLLLVGNWQISLLIDHFQNLMMSLPSLIR